MELTGATKNTICVPFLGQVFGVQTRDEAGLVAQVSAERRAALMENDWFWRVGHVGHVDQESFLVNTGAPVVASMANVGLIGSGIAPRRGDSVA